MSQREPAGQMFTRQVEEPFRVVCADFMGPLPRSRHGNALLLVFLDAFKKWVELVPLRKATTALLERAFRNRILSRFGTPKLFVCDNGTQFTSRSFKAFCKGMGMELQHTAPYNPQQNPTERANGTIKTMVVTYLDGAEQSKWDELLPELSLAINTSVSDTTKFSPAFLVQERDPRLPNTLFDQVTPVQATDHPTLERKAERMRELFQAVRDNTARASAEQSRYYNLRRREWRPTVGSWVLQSRHILSKASEGFTVKLAAKYNGPFKVHKFLSPNLLQLQVPGTRRRSIAGLSDLNEYHPDDTDEDNERAVQTSDTQ